MELGNLLENFKTDILEDVGSQLDALQAKKMQDEERATMSIFCPRCRTKTSPKGMSVKQYLHMSHLYRGTSDR